MAVFAIFDSKLFSIFLFVEKALRISFAGVEEIEEEIDRRDEEFDDEKMPKEVDGKFDLIENDFFEKEIAGRFPERRFLDMDIDRNILENNKEKGKAEEKKQFLIPREMQKRKKSGSVAVI